MLLWGMNDLQRRYMNQFKMNNHCFYATLISVALHLLWSYLLVTKAGMGIRGTGLANLIS
jgi:hypothetical protein